MKTKILLIFILITVIVIGYFKQAESGSIDFFLVNDNSEINKIILRSLDYPYSRQDKILTDQDKIRELWEDITSLKVREVKQYNTYTEPNDEWELIFYCDKGAESLQILYQGNLIRKEDKMYIPIESKIDMENIFKNF